MLIILNIPELFGVSVEVYLILLVLAVPTFLFWRWLLKKFIKGETERKIATWAATIFATPLIYAGVMMTLLFAMTYYPNNKFNNEDWLSDKEKRYELSKDIINSKMLIGKSKTQVRQILGDGGNVDSNNDWHYYLGYRPALFNIDPSTLEVDFKDGKVIEVEQHK